MNNYYKYLPTSAEDEEWGLKILNAGCNIIAPKTHYPDKTHPAHHYFNWEKGRILQEYQLVYITGGGGKFYSQTTGWLNIEAGTMMMIFAGEAHSYRPDYDTGWNEFWIGFTGPVIQNLVDKKFFGAASPIFKIGFNESLLNLFIQVINATKEEKAGFQPLLAGITLHILGQLHTIVKQRLFTVGDAENISNRARLMMRASVESNISPQDIASELQISYSKFRKLFKEYTGIAPVQYLIQLKLERAKELLTNPGKSIKEISFDLNFESPHYFSSLFKEKTGLTPLAYRKSVIVPGGE